LPTCGPPASRRGEQDIAFSLDNDARIAGGRVEGLSASLDQLERSRRPRPTARTCSSGRSSGKPRRSVTSWNPILRNIARRPAREVSIRRRSPRKRPKSFTGQPFPTPPAYPKKLPDRSDRDAGGRLCSAPAQSQPVRTPADDGAPHAGGCFRVLNRLRVLSLPEVAHCQTCPPIR